MKIRTLHYVHHNTAIDWIRLGWIVVKPHCEIHHDFYNVTMEWLCDCKMVRPKKEMPSGS